jgi:uncharacterized membrane protein
MFSISDPAPERPPPRRQHPVRRAVLRGLAIILPPLLTIVLFLWAWAQIERYVLEPIEGMARNVIVLSISDVKNKIPDEVPVHERLTADDGRVISFKFKDRVYIPVDGGKQRWIPQVVFNNVKEQPGEVSLASANEKLIYHQYVRNVYLKRVVVIPVFLCLFMLCLYVVGKFLAAGVGRMFWNFFEALIHRLPLIRNVYSSVKQVTDFVFSEREIEFTRVVAVEYPRKGIWSLGFVTGESMLDMRSAANEPVVSLLMPTSPMPATGFTITVLKSETIDLDITMDQAIQFIVSCGVVVPLQQQWRTDVSGKVLAAIAKRNGDKVRDAANGAFPTAAQETNGGAKEGSRTRAREAGEG